MKSILSIRVFRFAGFIFSVLCVVATVASGQSRQKIHIQNAKDTTGPASVQQLLKAGRLEAESIEILPGSAVPAVIHRPAGKFILLLVNHSKDAAAKFVLDPAAVGDGAPGADPVLQLA